MTVIAVVVAFSSPSLVNAQPLEWNNSTGTPDPFFDVADNWDPSMRPDATKGTFFNLAGSYEVWWDATTELLVPEVGNMSLWNGDVTFKNVAAGASLQYKLSMPGSGFSALSVERSGTRLTLSGIHMEALPGIRVIDGAELVVDGSHAAGSTLSTEGMINLNGGVGGNAASLVVSGGGLITGGPSGPASLSVDSASTATVDGAGSQMLLDRLDLYSGNVNVTNGGYLETNQTELARVDIGVLAGETGTVTVDGSGSNWNSYEIGIGLAGGTGVVTVQNGGRIDSEAINISGLSSTGTLRVNGAESEVDSASINVGSGGFNAFLEIENGGQVVSENGTVGNAFGGSGEALIIGSGSQWDIASSLMIGSETSFGNVLVGSGGSLATDSAVIEAGGVTITGVGSSWDNAGLLLINSDEEFSDSTIGVNAGGSLHTGSLYVANTQFGEVDVVGAGSTATVDNVLIVGGASNLSRVLVRNGGSFEVGGAATIGLQGDGNLQLINNATFQSDTLNIGPSGLLSLFSGSQITTGELQLGGGMQLRDGTINVTNLDSVLNINQSAFNYFDPTLELDDSTLNIAGQTVFGSGVKVFVENAANLTSASVINNGTINVTNSAVMGSHDRHDGYGGNGTLNVGTASVTLNDAGLADLGRVTRISGGTISASNGISIGSGDTISGNGQINGRISGGGGSAIYASGGNLTIGDDTHVAGFSTSGELYTLANTITILDDNQARLGSYTELGDASGAGSLVINNGAVINFGDNLVGYGTIDNQDTLATAIINNGAMIGNSAIDRLFVEGYVKGVGTFDNVQFNGTFAPGLSPACIDGTNFFFGPGSSLEMELGGLIRCAEHDAIRASGLLALDGSLDVLLINGFAPELGDSFDLFDWGSIDGAFANFDLPTLDGGLRWDLSELYTTGTLSVSAVPEPSSLVLLCGFAWIGLARRKRRTN